MEKGREVGRGCGPIISFVSASTHHFCTTLADNLVNWIFPDTSQMSGFRFTLTGVTLWKEPWGHVILCFKTSSHRLPVTLVLHSRDRAQPHCTLRWAGDLPVPYNEGVNQTSLHVALPAALCTHIHRRKYPPSILADFICGTLTHTFSFIPEMSQSVQPNNYKLPVSPLVFPVLKSEFLQVSNCIQLHEFIKNGMIFNKLWMRIFFSWVPWFLSYLK